MPKDSKTKRVSPTKAPYGASSKYINETQEQMCIGLNKKIVVVDFLPKEDRHIISPSNKFCDQNLAIKYDIEYFPIPYMSNDAFSRIKEFPAVKSIDNCVSIIIHARTNGNKEIKDNLLSFLDTFKPFRNTTVIFDDTASEFPTIVSKGYLDRHSITGVKFLNVMIQHGWNLIERFVSDNKTLLYVPPKYYNINPAQFECKWWFKYYINKAFDCGKGRLSQYSGTCYLNSAINGIILSNTAHRIALMYMNKELQSNPLLLSQIKQDITGLSCLVSKRSTPVSILYRILYNIFCKYDKVLSIDKRDGEKPLDIMIKSSQQFFSPANNPSALDYGEGGFSEYVLYTLFFEMKSKFVVNFNEEFYNPVISLPADGFFGYINILPVSSDEDILNADFLLYIYNPSKAFSDALPIIQIGPTKFDLEFSQISLKFSKDDFHEICGYICDGNYKIFDSAGGIIETVEWNNLSNPDVRTYMEKTLAFAWTKNVVVEGMTSIVYINSNKKYSYHDEGVCPAN